MKRKNIVNFIQLLQRDILIYENTLSQLVTAEKQAEYRDMITHAKAKLSFYEENLRLKDEKKDLKAKDKEPKEKAGIKLEYGCVGYPCNTRKEPSDSETEQVEYSGKGISVNDFHDCCRNKAQSVDNECIGWDKAKEEKKEFDWNLNMKFAIFNGWEYRKNNVNKKEWLERNNETVWQTYTKPFWKEFVNYIEDPKLIQETIDRIEKTYNVILVQGFNKNNIHQLATFIDEKEKELQPFDVGKRAKELVDECTKKELEAISELKQFLNKKESLLTTTINGVFENQEIYDNVDNCIMSILKQLYPRNFRGLPKKTSTEKNIHS